MSVLILCLIYGLFMFSMSGSTSLMVLLLLLEMLSWLFILIMEMFLALKYLLIQSYFLMTGVFALLWCPQALTLILMLKMGLPPVHAWFLHILLFLSTPGLVFGMTIHKLLPLLLLPEINHDSSGTLMLLVIMLISLALLFNSVLLFLVVFYSSANHTVWMCFSSYWSKPFVFSYWTAYSLLLLAFVIGLGSSVLLYSNLVQNTMSLLVWLLLSGFPPFIMFWLKITLISTLWKSVMVFSLIMLIGSVISMSVYYRVFHLGVMTTGSHISYIITMLTLISLYSTKAL